jgi:prepilin-type N-terminal cleavage/methylation domain-containing protein
MQTHCRKAKPLFGLTLIELLVVIAIIGIIVGLFLPATRSAREPARRMHSMNNLEQIVSALQNYESRYGVLPPSKTLDGDGTPLHSWRTLILPFLEQQELYDSIDLTKPWDAPENQKAREATPPPFFSAAIPREGQKTTYLAIVSEHSYIHPTHGRRWNELKEKEDKRWILIDVPFQHATHWMSPHDISPDELLAIHWSQEVLHHPRIILTAKADGTSQQIKVPIDKNELREALGWTP